VEVNRKESDVTEGAEDSSVKIQDKDEGIAKKNSFAKEILLGRFDTDILTFPEALDKERFDTLNEMVAPVERFYREEGLSLYYNIIRICINRWMVCW